MGMGERRLLELRGTRQVRPEQVVPARLAGLPLLSCFGFDVHEPEPVRRRKIPGGTVKIGFALDGVFEGRALRPFAFVVGMHDRGGFATHAGRLCGVQVQLDPLTARRLLGVPLHELRNRRVDLDEFLGPSAREATERLGATRSWADRFEVVGGYLREWFARTDYSGDPAIAYAAGLLRRSGGRVPLNELISESGWSPRHFRRRFADDIGLSPKTFGALTRFTAALRAAAAAPEPDLSRIADESGYYDQAHMHRDFLRFAGAPPGRLLG
ncbi:AraC family transcriptional regulator [Nocardia arthritidis]|uniref:Helix-turn-helix domain-containing protein n=1 Tax=Nocardia arthritidis TaxID=228602 RepID=A0A6G9YPJ1_9NOCA|nr:helix-turn-helix domain-containing protein [Nocardia arthritidis]QIS15215.1 helix-turn-helix domain-containing protein [Nocardia arthritidis]